METAQAALSDTVAALEDRGIDGVQLLGPSPACIHKLRAEYPWQITVKSRALERVRRLVPAGRGWSIDIDPVM